MAFETVAHRERWGHWRGSADDIVRVAERVRELLTDAGQSDPSLYIRLTRVSGETRYDSVEDAAHGLPRADLSDLTRIYIGGGDPFGDLTISVTFEKGLGVYLKVEGKGSEHIKAAGIAADLKKGLDPGDRSRPWYWRPILIAA